ncbi:MAG: outer membrane beta-barrel protein [Succinivibrio sp.]
MKKTLCALVLSSAFYSAISTAAVPDSWVVGLGLGHVKGNVQDMDNLTTYNGFYYRNATADDGDMTGTGFKIFGEYNFKTWLSVGVGYNRLDSGSFKVKEYYRIYNGFSAVNQYNTYKFDADINVFELYAKFNYSFDNVGSEVFAKVGGTLNHSDIDGLDGDSVTGGIVLGVGGQYAFTQNFAVRAGFDYFYNTASFTYKDRDENKWDESAHLANTLLYCALNYTF